MNKNYKKDKKEVVAKNPSPLAEPKTEKNQSIQLRLNKYIASCGVCSRREADKLILAGEITVNGIVVTQLGSTISYTDKVLHKGKELESEKKVYVLLNKPKDTITTTDDPDGKRTVLDIVNHDGSERIYPVGRLDRNTTGVLLLTNDGELAKQLTHPSHNRMKIYHVTLDKPLSKEDMDIIEKGFNLEDGFIKADAISYVEADDNRQCGIEIHSGRNRIVRRIFEHLGYQVQRLDRVYFAGLTKKGLARGRWRYLSTTEVAMLKMGSYK